MKVEVLVATMNQKDISLYKKMNLSTNVVFANQSDKNAYEEIICNDKSIKLITTSDRGVGKNRNNAIMHSTGDICLFSDDDMIYVDNYESIITNAFKEIPNADIIIFNIEMVGIEASDIRVNNKIKKVHMFNCLNYGAPRIAVKRNSLIKKNVWFSLLYGGGAPYSSGEDSLFITEALRKGMKIYTYPAKIADVKQETSTWFNGYTQKYFEDRGVWLANAFPNMKWLLGFYYSYKLRKSNPQFSIYDINKMINKGICKFDDKK